MERKYGLSRYYQGKQDLKLKACHLVNAIIHKNKKRQILLTYLSFYPWIPALSPISWQCHLSSLALPEMQKKI